jgi:hypothetical protein
MKTKLIAIAAAGALILGAGVASAQDASWIHVRVMEDDGAKVSVNLPMSLIEVAMEIAEKEIFDGHGISMGGHHGDDFEVADIRRMWGELRDAGDAEYVTAEEGDETVRVYRQGDRVFVNIDEDGEEKVRLQVPFSVVDTLLEGDGDELNLVGALREMARSSDSGEIIQVKDGETNVRVWIDNNSQD